MTITLRNRLLSVAVLAMTVLVAWMWTDSVILRYKPVIYVIMSSVLIGLALVVRKPAEDFKRIVLYGTIVGYVIGMICNNALEYHFVEHFMQNFLNGISEMPLQVVSVLLLYPLILGAWLQGMGIAVAVWLYRTGSS